MDLRQLTYLCKIAETGSFSAAARELGIAQPAVSQQIANLEADLDTQLLVRSIRGAQLTATGQTLYAHAQKILAQVRAAQDDVSSEAATPKGVVTVVLPRMLTRPVGPRLMRRVMQNLPRVELGIHEALGLTASEMVRTGRCDFGVIATAGPPDTPDNELLYRETLYHVRAAPAAEDPRPVGHISFEDMLTHSLILSKERHGVRAIIEAVAREKKLRVDPLLETESSRLMLACVEQGLGSCVLPWPSVSEYLGRGALIADRIDAEHLMRQVSLIWAPEHQPTTGAKAVAAELRQIIKDCIAQDLIRTA